jgi:hypothetical protein
MTNHHIGIFNISKDFFDAASKLKNDDLYWPMYYLYGHAIELLLKSYLCFKGMKDDELRKIGHNLMKAWNKCSGLGLLELIGDYQVFRECVFMMNAQYMGKELEYHVKGYKQLPDINQMHDATKTIINYLDAYYRCEVGCKNNQK